MTRASTAPGLLACASLLGLLSAPASAGAGERPAIGRIGAGVQLGGFYDLSDPGLEFRGWARRFGASFSLGRHYADPSEPELTEVSSEPGKQLSAGVLFAFTDPPRSRAVPIKLYATAGVVHVTQARGQWEVDRPPPGASFVGGGTRTYAESAVEGSTGTGGYVGLGAEVGFRFLPGLSLGAELLAAGFGGDEGAAPGVRFALRYYPW